MARCVEDLEIIFRVIAGFDGGDPMASPVPIAEISEHELKRITIGYFEEHPSAPVTAEVRAAVQSSISALQHCGFRIKPFMPDVLSEACEHWWTLFVRLAAELLTPQFKGREDEVSTILTYSDRIPTKEDLLSAWFRRDELRLCLMRHMNDIPVLICPVCSVPAFRHGEREWRIGGRSVSYMDAMSYTQWFNLLGNPAVVVPVGVSPEGLPIGVQVVGQPNSEELILKVARALEKAVGPSPFAPALLE
jgi:Asp-tRNA(Asn)/Glu-tRNA(Gln) amidotransferase A subunit family amidase